MGKRKPYVKPQAVVFKNMTLTNLNIASSLLNIRPSCVASLCTELGSTGNGTGELVVDTYAITTPPSGTFIPGEVARIWMEKANLRTLDMLRPVCASCTRCSASS